MNVHGEVPTTRRSGASAEIFLYVGGVMLSYDMVV